MCSQTDNTAAVIGGVVAVVFTIMTALTVIVIAILVLRYRRGNYSTGTKQKYNNFLCDSLCACIYTTSTSDLE